MIVIQKTHSRKVPSQLPIVVDEGEMENGGEIKVAVERIDIDANVEGETVEVGDAIRAAVAVVAAARAEGAHRRRRRLTAAHRRLNQGTALPTKERKRMNLGKLQQRKCIIGKILIGKTLRT